MAPSTGLTGLPSARPPGHAEQATPPLEPMKTVDEPWMTGPPFLVMSPWRAAGLFMPVPPLKDAQRPTVPLIPTSSGSGCASAAAGDGEEPGGADGADWLAPQFQWMRPASPLMAPSPCNWMCTPCR
ncbi:hypothetical protein CHL79_01065 [Delftia acidovorans]|nr:hypothetical protein CHL79_01065 [Delftia acidovorans]